VPKSLHSTPSVQGMQMQLNQTREPHLPMCYLKGVCNSLVDGKCTHQAPFLVPLSFECGVRWGRGFFGFGIVGKGTFGSCAGSTAFCESGSSASSTLVLEGMDKRCCLPEEQACSAVAVKHWSFGPSDFLWRILRSCSDQSTRTSFASIDLEPCELSLDG